MNRSLIKSLLVISLAAGGYAMQPIDNQDELGRALYEEDRICVKLDKVLPGLEYGDQIEFTGVKILDNLFIIHDVQAITPRFKLNSAIKQEDLPELSSIYLLELGPETDMWELIRDLSALNMVLYAEPVGLDYMDAVPNDSLYANLHHLPQIQAEEAWDIHQGEQGTETIVIGIVDSGVEWTHPDLAANIHQNLGEDADGDGQVVELIAGSWSFDPDDVNGIDDDGNGYVDDFVGWNMFADGEGAQNNDPSEPSGSYHGTHVAGLAAAVTNNSEGIASISWNVEYMPTSHGYEDGGPHIYSGYQGIIYHAENGADIINNSWGGGLYAQAAAEVLEYAQGLGSIVFASAGNSGGNYPHYPSDYPGVISVAAMDPGDFLASYSNYGAGVDISSPGGSSFNGLWSTMPWGYDQLQGTSMAGPLAAGTLALLKSYHPAWSNEDLIYQFLATADDRDAEHNSELHGLMGYGRVNAYRMLSETDPVLDDGLELVLHEVQSSSEDLLAAELVPGQSVDISFLIRNFSAFRGDVGTTFTLSSSSDDVTITPASQMAVVPPDHLFALDSAFQLDIDENAAAQYVVLTLHADPFDAPIHSGEDMIFQFTINPVQVQEELLAAEIDWPNNGTASLTLSNSSNFDVDYNVTAWDPFPSSGAWHLNEDHAYDGLSWWAGYAPIQQYPRWSCEIMELPVIDLSETTSPVLNFMAMWEIEPPSVSPPWDGWDAANVWISVDGGLSFEPLRPVYPAYTCESAYAFEMYFDGDSIPGWAGSSGGWVPVQFDLSDYRSERVVIRMVMASDPAQQDLGFFWDNLTLEDGENTLLLNEGEEDFRMKLMASSWFETESEWISFDDASGTVAANSSISIPVTIETADLTLGGYVNQLNVTSSTMMPIGDLDLELYVASPANELAIREYLLSNDDYRVAEDEVLEVVIDNYGSMDAENFVIEALLYHEGDRVWSDSVFVDLLQGQDFGRYDFRPYFVDIEGELQLEIRLLDLPHDAVVENNEIIDLLEIETILDRFWYHYTEHWDYGEWDFSDMSGYQDGQSMHCNAGVTPYQPNMDNALTFTSGVDLDRLESFAIRYSTLHQLETDADFGYFEISFDQENWMVVNSHTGTAISWNHHTVDLTEYCSNDFGTLYFRFHFTSDADDELLGFFVDHVLFQVPELVSRDEQQSIPERFVLNQNYPNPFNPSTTLRYELPKAGDISITVYDINGRHVAKLVDGRQAAGYHQVNWSGLNDRGMPVSTGIYFCRLQVSPASSGETGASQPIKMLLME